MDVLVLGNGFDLSHNLPTTYLCFLKVTEYLDKKTIKEEITIGTIFDSIKDNCSQIKNSYDAYESVYDDYKLDIDRLFMLCEICKKNEWWNYFANVFDKDVGWIDFEKEISSVLEQIDSFVTQNSNAESSCRLEDPNAVIAAAFPFFIKTTNILSKQICHPSNNAFIIYDCDYCYKPEYIVQKRNQISEVNRNKIATELFDRLVDFSKALKLYFELFVDETMDSLMKEGLINTNEKFKNYDDIITYNYTKSFEKIYEKETVAHIHGVLGQPIVLGVNPDDNDESNGDLTFISFKKYYQRVVLETDLDYLNLLQKMRTKINNNSRANLSIIGHSLDVTDKDSLKDLFESSSKITIYYHKREKVPLLLRNLIYIFGKKKFDELRNNKQLRFISMLEFSD